MKITRQTFPDALATVVAACSRASFVAIDCEMTGLATSKALMSSSIDSLDSRWARVRDSAASMGLVQFGVCPFEWDAGAGADKQGAFVARPFSFYLFPRVSPIGRESGVPGEGGDSFFVATSATLEFLRTHHFDFHDFVDGGVSFLSRSAEDRIRHVQRLKALRSTARMVAPGERERTTVVVIDQPAPPASQAAEGAQTSTLSVPVVKGASAQQSAGPPAAADANVDEIKLTRPVDIEWYHALCAFFDKWEADIAAWVAGGALAPPHGSLEFETFSFGAGADATTASFPYVVLEPANSFRRNVINALVKARFGSGLDSNVRVSFRDSDAGANTSDWDKALRVTFIGAGTRGFSTWVEGDLQRKVMEIDAQLKDAVGFRHVIDAIAASRVPVVGHNCWLDLAHTTTKFIGPAPAGLADWALELSRLFPVVYDTKIMVVGEGDLAPDPLLPAAFRNRNNLSQAFHIVNAKSTTTINIPKPAAPAPPAPAAAPASQQVVEALVTEAASTDAVAPAAAPTAAPAAAPARANGRRAGWGRGNREQVEMDKVEVETNWPEYAPIVLAEGFGADSPASVGAGTDAGVAATSGEEEYAHDAGFDAYMTGVVFARVAARLASVSVPGDAVTRVRAPALAPSLLPALFAEPPAPLRALRNVLNMMRSRGPLFKAVFLEHASELARSGRSRAAVPNPDIEGDSKNTLLLARAAAYRANVVHVEGIDVSVRSDDIGALFAHALGIEASLIEKNVTWINDVSAFVQLPTAEHAAAIVTAVSGDASASSSDGSDGSAGAEDAPPASSMISWIAQQVTGEKGGDNMLGLGASSPKKSRREIGGAADGDDNAASAPVSAPNALASLPTSAFTTAAIASLAPPLTFSAMRVTLYSDWLALNSRVFGEGCAHEVVPRVYTAKGSDDAAGVKRPRGSLPPPEKEPSGTSDAGRGGIGGIFQSIAGLFGGSAGGGAAPPPK